MAEVKSLPARQSTPGMWNVNKFCRFREPRGSSACHAVMDLQLINAKFARMCARVKAVEQQSRSGTAVTLDVRADRHGEFFEVMVQPGTDAEISVLDVQPTDRHLLLFVREGNEKSKFLCGHDERHWFVAGIPENAPVGTVRQAKEALKPTEVQTAQASKRLNAKARGRRKNAAYVRQGEWFFLPVAGMVVDEARVLRNEPLRRGIGGKPHLAEFCYRTGGEGVWVCSRYPNGVTESGGTLLFRDRLNSGRRRFQGNS